MQLGACDNIIFYENRKMRQKEQRSHLRYTTIRERWAYHLSRLQHSSWLSHFGQMWLAGEISTFAQ
jgi:hypothetical protein